MQAQTNVLRVGAVTCPAGKTVSLPIEMENSSDIVGVQFDIDVPYELALDENNNTAVTLSKTRCANHTVTTRLTSSGHWRDPAVNGGVSSYKTYRIIVYSSENSRIVGSTGAVLTVDLPLPADLGNGVVYPVYLMANSVVLTNREQQNVLTSQADGSVTIETVPRPDLQPSNVRVKQTLVDPAGELEFSWTVKNIGDLATGAGWTERIYLESQTTGAQVYVGTTAYDGTLAVNGSVSRTATFTLDDFPGIGGLCRPVVQVVPAADCGESTINQANNTATASSYSLRVNKYLQLTANKTVIPKNSTNGYYCELRRTGNTSIAETFNITSRDASGKTDRLRFSNDGTVTFAKGSNRTSFYVYAVQNNRYDVDPKVAVIVNANQNNGYDVVTDTVTMEETNLVPLTFTVDKSDYNEGETIHLTVSVPQRPWAEQLAVYLNIEEQKRFKLPQRIVFPDGALQATIDIPIIQDNQPANDMSIRLSGTAEHYQTGEVVFMLHDDDTPAISMTLSPKTVSEGAGPQAMMGIITRTEVTNNKITIKLADDGLNDIYYSQQTLTMPAGTTTVKFPLGVKDNQEVDGDRTVRIRASVYMSDCNCDAIGDKQAVVIDSITITDDDGPTLSVIANQSTILEGAEEGCTLTISRNTTSGGALAVTLTSDAADVEFSKTVTIPAGQKSVTTTFRALSNDVAEGDRTVSVVAQATGYSAGSTWLLISDRTMPDLTITSFTLDKTLVNEGTPIYATIQVKNIGSAAAPSNVPVKLYYGDTEWTTYTIPVVVNKGEAKTFTFRPKNFPCTGTYQVKAVVNPDNKPVELLTTNNTSQIVELTGNSLYNYTLAAKKTGYNVGEKANFTGTCIGIDGQVNTVHNLWLFMDCNGQRESFGPTGGIRTDGSFIADRTIPASFSGTVKIGACNRADIETSQNYLGSFEVYGMQRTETSYTVHEVYKDETSSFVMRLRNTCGLALHNVSMTFTGATNNYDIQVTPIATLPANGEVDLKYTITGKSLTNITNYEQIQFQIKCDEGATLNVNTWNFVKMRTADLAVSENNIKTTVQITQPRTYPIWLTNKGETATGKITISLPTGMGKFVTLASASQLPSLERGDSTMILLRFDSQGFDVNVEQTGTIAINCENGNGTVIHFSVTTVSESKGNLKVYVQDEMTIYGDKDGNHPYVSEATVRLKDYNTGADIKTLTTDASGYVTFNDINEGFYQLYVTAPKHDDYRQNVTVSPGETKNHTATISYQAIGVSWDVVETEVEDEYEIISTLTYETQVPVPVIVMSAPDTLGLDLLDEGKSMLYNIILRNEGLIAAQSTNLTLPEVEGFTFTPLVQHEGVIVGAQQSYVIPVRVTHNVEQTAGTRGMFKAASNLPCNSKYLADWEWPCGSDHKHAWVAKTVNLIKDVGTGGNGGCSGGDGGGAWGGSGGTPVYGGLGNGLNFRAASDGALRGTIDLLCAMSNLVPTPDWSDDVDDIRDYVDIWQSNDSGWNKIKNTLKTNIKHKVDGQIKDIKDAVTNPGGIRDKINDWKNFYNGVKNVYEGVGRGDYLSRSHRPHKAEGTGSEDDEMDPAMVEGTVEYYQNLLENYVDNSYFLTYLTKMNLYGQALLTEFNLMEEIMNAPEALDNLTSEFQESIDTLNNIISEMVEGMHCSIWDSWSPPTMTGGKTIEEMQDRIDAVKLNGSDQYYDFSYDQYVSRMHLYYQKYAQWIGYLNYRESHYQMHGYYPQDGSINNELLWRDKSYPRKEERWLERDEIPRTRYINEYVNRLDSCENDLVLKGFESWDDLYESAQQDLLDMYENMGKNTCASVKLEIDQKLVMTRQAFRGTLTVENGLSTDLTGIELSLLVKDLLGNEATSHEFQINFESIDGFEGSVDGPWTLGPKAKGVATVLFIPTKYAAPEALTTWSFGGTLYFTDGDGVTQVRTLLPVSLQVKPSPVLDLTYFVQRDIYGDDPLTKDVIEPIVPAEFAVLINNKGNGDATNIRMFTHQPKIIDNEKGLFIDFSILSSRLNGGETVLALDSTIATVFGDIPAGKSSYAQWELTSSLLGHFTKYEIAVNHLTSYGNPDLSLLDEVTIHELIHSISLPKGALMGYWIPQTEDLHGWAVNDNLGINPPEVPDRMYVNDGTTLPIFSYIDKTTVQYKGNNTYWVTFNIDNQDEMQEGFNFLYTSFADPTMGEGGIKDAHGINTIDQKYQNLIERGEIWQTQYTMHDGGDPIRDNKVHLLIPFQKNRDGNTTFIVTFEPAPTKRLDVESIKTVPQGSDIAVDVLDELTVTFNKPINASTFTRDDMVLRYEGEKLTSNIAITKAANNDSVYTVKMQNVSRNGYYTLQVNTDGVNDKEGFAGKNGKQVGWMLFKGGLVQYNVEAWPTVAAGNIAMSDNIDTSGEIDFGTNVTMTAQPAEGYTFDYWGTVGEDVESVASARARQAAKASGNTLLEDQINRYSDENPVTVSMNKVYNMRAVFKPNKCTITIDCNERHGTVNVVSAVYDYGTVLNLEAEPVEGYRFVGYYDGDRLLSNQPTFAYTVKGTTTLTVKFKVITESILLKESVDYTPENIDQATVRLQRTFVKGGWNTVCLPCPVADPQAAFGGGTRVARLTGIDNRALQFETVEQMEANVPYLIWVGTLNSNQLISDGAEYQSIYNLGQTSISADVSTLSSTMGAATITGTYTDQTLAANKGFYLVKGLKANLVETATSSGRFNAFVKVTDRNDKTIKLALDGEILGEIEGDVNGDGQIGIGDIVAITNVMAGTNANPDIADRADVNGDGQVGIGDIVRVTNIMAGLRSRKLFHLLEDGE